jgi:hypothetical protein
LLQFKIDIILGQHAGDSTGQKLAAIVRLKMTEICGATMSSRCLSRMRGRPGAVL